MQRGISILANILHNGHWKCFLNLSKTATKIIGFKNQETELSDYWEVKFKNKEEWKNVILQLN